MASIISLGVAQMMQTARQSQRRIQILATFAEMQTRINTLLLDQSAFNFTINGNSGSFYDSLKNGALVTETATPQKMIVYDGSGQATFNLLGPSDNAGPYNGLTDKGTPCTTFYPTIGSGNDDCPISYRIMAIADCGTPAVTIAVINTMPAATTCTEPQLKIAARLIFNPSNANNNRVLNKYRNLVAIPPADVTSPAGKYDVLIKRTASSISRSFKLVSYVLGGVFGIGGCGTSLTHGAGPCTTLAMPGLIHPATISSLTTSGWVVEYDPNSLVTVNAAAGTFTINEIGNYICSATGYAFATGTFYLNLMVNGTVLASATTFASYVNGSSEAMARLDTSFYVSALGNTYSLFQKCDAVTVPAQCGTGISKSTSNTVHYPIVTLTCSKLDNAF